MSRVVHVCDVADCEQVFGTLDEVIAHERTHNIDPAQPWIPVDEIVAALRELPRWSRITAAVHAVEQTKSAMTAFAQVRGEAMAELRADRWSAVDIAAHLGISKQAVHSLIQRAKDGTA